MKKIKLFYLKNCPYCKAAMRYLDELMVEEPYASLDIEFIEETIQKELADSYDYYYVPSLYYQEKKYHEGAINKDELKTVLDAILNEDK